MIGRVRVLRGRILREIEDIERCADMVAARWQRVVMVGPDTEAYIDATALNLHAFYTGVERVFEDIANSIDETVPSGDAWHAKLIGQMALPIDGVRPAVIGEDLADQLDDYRRFRHLIRNVYATHLEAERMQSLVGALPGVWRDVRSALESFCDFLRSLIEDGD